MIQICFCDSQEDYTEAINQTAVDNALDFKEPVEVESNTLDTIDEGDEEEAERILHQYFMADDDGARALLGPGAKYSAAGAGPSARRALGDFGGRGGWFGGLRVGGGQFHTLTQANCLELFF